MEVVLENIQHFFDPNWIINNGGFFLVLLILFIETGVIIGFFLPGDPLLFISGMVLASANEVHYPFSNELLNLPFWMLLFSASTILGNFFGYWFGNKFKHIMHKSEDTWYLKRKHVETANEFYHKRGGFAIAIARFLPLVRTFAPIVAGSLEMDYKKFTFYNIIGAFIWVGSIVSLGYILGDNEWVKSNLEFVLLTIIVLVTAPVLIKLLFGRKGDK